MKKIPNREQINTRQHWNLAHTTEYPYSGYDFYCNLLYKYIPFLESHGYENPLGIAWYWLDFGCWIAKRNSILDFPSGKYVGFDLSDYITNINRKSDPNNLYVDSLKELEDKEISYISALHVFEHLTNPQEEFNRLWKMSTRYISIQVPYRESYRSCEQHLWEFDENSFVNIDDIEPTIIIGPQMNLEGEREILYFWDKQNTKKQRRIFSPYEKDFSGQWWYLQYQKIWFVEYYNSFAILILSKIFTREKLYKFKKYIRNFHK